MNVVKQRSAVKSSISVPPKEQPHFDEKRTSLMNSLEGLKLKMSFSNLVRLVVYGAVLDEREDGVYLTVKL
jgi:hypothetical protein